MRLQWKSVAARWFSLQTPLVDIHIGSNSPQSMPRRSIFPETAGFMAALLGAVGLIGWWWDIAVLKSIIPGATPIKPNFAAGMLLCGGVLALLALTRSAKPARICTAAAGIIVLVLGGLSLGEHFFGWNLEIERWLIRPGPKEASPVPRMSPSTALCLVLTGGMFFAQSQLFSLRWRLALVTGLSAALMMIGGLALGGFALELLFGLRWNLMGMNLSGVTGAVGFLLLGAGLLALLQSQGQLVWSLDRFTTMGFATGMLLVILSAAMAFSYTRRIVETTISFTHRQEVVGKIQELYADISELASGQRIYVIIGDEALLKAREQLKAKAAKDAASARELTSGNPAQQDRLDQLELLLRQRIEWEEQVIGIRRIEGFPAAAQVIGMGKGVNLSAEILLLLNQIEQEESQLLSQDRKEAEKAAAGYAILPFGVFLTVAVLALGLSFLNAGRAEQKQAEKALRAGEGRYRTLFESNPSPMWVYDEETLSFLAVNGAASRHYGFSQEEFLGMTIKDIRPPEDVPALMANLAQTSEELDETTGWRHRKKNGEFIDVEITSHELVWLGRPARLVLINDVTARKRAENQIRQLNLELEERVHRRTAELEAANKELEAFSYSVSHDLRSPLRTVDGFSQAVLEDYGMHLPDEGRRYLQTIRDGAQRMGVLIDDLLSFSRLSRLPLHRQTVDMKRIVRETLDELNSEKQERKIDINIGDLPKGYGDPALLKQVWLNLISNALKYTRQRETATIRIGCKDENGTGTYFVSDNGTGFDMQYAHKLFGVFQRLHRTDEFEGTGVGLAIVQRVIHRHGGQVWVEAALGEGATFYFTLEGGNNNV